jgi:hypothetical protein
MYYDTGLMDVTTLDDINGKIDIRGHYSINTSDSFKDSRTLIEDASQFLIYKKCQS